MKEAAKPAPGRREARKAERRAAIVAVAWRHFLEHGYDRTSMSAIAEEMGGSKGTLWSYFASKEELFTAAIDEVTTAFRASVIEILTPSREPREALTILAERLIDRITLPDAIALQRLIVGEVERFPEIGRIFYDRGPGAGQAVLIDYITAQVRAGNLSADDPREAALMFFNLCAGGYHQHVLWGIADHDDRRAKREAALAVQHFLHCYGAHRPAAG
ncbi:MULTISPECIES: TetR/AcrR family transcriptional regulator [unclassified Sphingomonas]|mgnify:FL=1|uniref:TetR/AcrR family transcriptional regulator n=1 Tax=unclassified Sphingomonas TaxID=196159 RepID=UPI00092CB3FE|nr:MULTISPECIES: TetR/AcrR family transcriptional regulator [unclassified Sphingomonas]OJU17788.1 MAG: hypothetical protein BGN95_15945 [Sphingomonas sp. 66-10]